MNPFRKLGRQVEQFKSKAKQAAEEQTDYRCTECDTRFGEHHQRCPECDAESVVAIGDESGP